MHGIGDDSPHLRWQQSQERGLPLRLAPRRFWLWALALMVIGLAQVRFTLRLRGLQDWSDFWMAGQLVGSPLLLDSQAQSAWRVQHQLDVGTFPYLPGSAWALVPFAHLTLLQSFILDSVIMLACIAAAGFVAGPLYHLDRTTSVGMSLAWVPTMSAIVIGQNSPLGLLLVMSAVNGLVKGSVFVAAVPIGLLLYKPTYALPLVLLLVIRKRWPELSIVCGIGLAWYLLCAVAVGGNYAWPTAWLHYLAATLRVDIAFNASKAISLPGILMRGGVQPLPATLFSMALVAPCIPLLRRVSMLEAASAVCLLGLAASPHAWGYDAALAMPMLYFASTHVPEPQRTRIVVAAYLTAPTLLCAAYLGFNPLAIIVFAGSATWAAARWRFPDPPLPRPTPTGRPTVAHRS